MVVEIDNEVETKCITLILHNAIVTQKIFKKYEGTTKWLDEQLSIYDSLDHGCNLHEVRVALNKWKENTNGT